MPFISSSDEKNAYLMKYIFSRFTRCNKWHIHDKNLNFLFNIYNFKRVRFFALNNVTLNYVHTLRHINDNVAQCAMLAKTETIGAGVEKVKISANPDNLITKIFLAIYLRK